MGPSPLLPPASQGHRENWAVPWLCGCRGATEVLMQLWAESSLSWSHQEGDPFSFHLSGSEKGWPSPNTQPLLRI